MSQPETKPAPDMLRQSPRAWLEINMESLSRNYLRIRKTVAPCEVMPVLKANAYGIGVTPVADALFQAGARRFGVADLNEGLALAESGYRVQILGAVMPDEIGAALEAGITIPVTDVEIGREISREALRQKREGSCHVLIDSGMGRLGLPLDQAEAGLKSLTSLPGLEIDGIYSHFPVANYPQNHFTRAQIENFLTLLNRLRQTGISFNKIHIANSDGINNFPRGSHPPFNLVRSGINLYGAFDLLGGRAYQLHSVLTLKSRLAQVRRLPAGTPIGYGHTVILPRESLIGTVSAGYADGVPIALSNRGHVLIQGRACPVLGTVSMDYCTVCLDNVPQAGRGEEVVLLGQQNQLAVTVQDWAELKQSNPYDIICSIGSRVIRRYLNVIRPSADHK